MFTPHLNAAVGFQSSWKTEQQLTFSGTQTEEISTQDSECQVLQTAECAVQTDEVLPPTASKDVNEASLLEFLRRIVPKVEEELKKQERSAAFESYEGVDEQEGRGALLQHTLRWPKLFAQGVVTGLSWSSTGAVVAVSYGADTHDTWCQHRAAVALWNINRSEGASISPERLLEVSSCVPALAFHPSNPAILAVATRTGEVHVYDLSDSESVTPIATGFTGGSGVTCLVWRSGGSVLAAATQGGHVLLWALSLTKQTLTLESGLVVVQEDLPRSHRSGGAVTAPTEGVGITSLSFNSEDPTVFVVGVEGGSVLLCSTSQQMPSSVKVEGIQCRRCVVSSVSGHSGRVVTAQLSLHHRNALISLGSDDTLKLHSLLQAHQPVSALYSDSRLTAALWSPARPLLLALGNTTGQVQFLDVCNLQASEGRSGGPLLELPSPEKPAPVTSLAFNTANVSLIAVGDSLGRVWVWKLPTDVVSPHTTDLPRLTSLLAHASDD